MAKRFTINMRATEETLILIRRLAAQTGLSQGELVKKLLLELDGQLNPPRKKIGR